MKNRNIPYYVAVLALAAGMSTSFVSCVDTEEPESITELRKAKAEEVRAEAKVQEALAGLKDAEAAYKKAEERAKIADAVTTELNNKLLEVKNNLEADKITGKHDLEVAKAKEDAQAELDAAKQKAAIALAGYEKALKEAQIKARVGLAQLLAEGIGEEGADGELKTLLDTYNDELETLEEKVTDLKDALKALDDSDEETLAAQVEEKANALALAQKNKTDFEALVTRASAADYQTKWEELQKTIDNIAPRTNKLNYEIQDLTNKIEQKQDEIESDLEDYLRASNIKEGDELYVVDEKLQKIESIKEYDNEGITNIDGTLTITDDEWDMEKYYNSLSLLKDELTKVANVLQNDIDKYNAAQAEKSYKGVIDAVRKDDNALLGKWNTAVNQNDGTDGKISALRTAAKNLFGNEADPKAFIVDGSIEGTGGAPIVTEPTIENIAAYLLGHSNIAQIYDEEHGDIQTAAENIYYNHLGAFSACVAAEKSIADANIDVNAYTEAQKLIKKIDEDLKAIDTKIEAFGKDILAAIKAEDYQKLLSDKAAKEKEKEGLETEQGYAESLQGIIAAFTGFGDGGFEFDDQEGEGGTFTVGEDYTEKYNAAIKILDKDIAKATKDKEKADANLAAYQAAVKAGQTGDFEAVDTNVSDDLADLGEKIQAIIDAQEALKEQQKAADKAKAAYDTKVEYYKEKTN